MCVCVCVCVCVCMCIEERTVKDAGLSVSSVDIQLFAVRCADRELALDAAQVVQFMQSSAVACRKLSGHHGAHPSSASK